MKRTFIVILTVVLALSLCACGDSALMQGIENLSEVELPPLPELPKKAEPTPEPVLTPEPTAEPTPTPVPEKAAPGRVLVSIDRSYEKHYAPDESEQLILIFDYDSPIVSIEGRDEAAHKINDFTAYLEEEYYTGMTDGEFNGGGDYGMIEQAEDNYRYAMDNGSDIALEFASSRAVDVLRADSNVLSLVYNDYVFTGGTHPNSVNEAYVFDTESGNRLHLEDITSDYEAFSDFLISYMTDKAQNDENVSCLIAPDVIENEDYETAFAAVLRDGSWYLSENGLVIFTDDEEFGSHAQGHIVFTIPYNELNGLIDSKWVPVEYEGECSLSVTDAPAEGTEILDKVNISESGEQLYIAVDGTAYQVKVASVDYSDRFYETAEHWYCSYVDDMAIQMSVNVPDGMPDLMISYYSADGEEHNLLLSQNGADGGYTLVPDTEIEAVG